MTVTNSGDVDAKNMAFGTTVNGVSVVSDPSGVTDGATLAIGQTAVVTLEYTVPADAPVNSEINLLGLFTYDDCFAQEWTGRAHGAAETVTIGRRQSRFENWRQNIGRPWTVLNEVTSDTFYGYGDNRGGNPNGRVSTPSNFAEIGQRQLVGKAHVWLDVGDRLRDGGSGPIGEWHDVRVVNPADGSTLFYDRDESVSRSGARSAAFNGNPFYTATFTGWHYLLVRLTDQSNNSNWNIQRNPAGAPANQWEAISPDRLLRFDPI